MPDRTRLAPRHAGLLSVGVWMLSMTLAAAGLVFLVLSASTPEPWRFGPRGADLVLAVALSTVAAVITARRPDTPVGWLLGAAGVVAAVTGFGMEYRVFAVLARPGAPFGAVVAWVVEWVWPLLIGVLAAVFLLFPDSDPRSSRKRALLWLTAGGTLLWSTGIALRPGPLTEFPVVDNPVRWGASARSDVVGVVGTAGTFVLVLVFVTAGVVLVLRFRDAEGERRQQLKWIAFVGALVVLAFAVNVVWFLFADGAPAAVQWSTVCALSVVPVAVGLAVLKYRLYDIDRIINRTIVYALLTALLVTSMRSSSWSSATSSAR